MVNVFDPSRPGNGLGSIQRMILMMMRQQGRAWRVTDTYLPGSRSSIVRSLDVLRKRGLVDKGLVRTAGENGEVVDVEAYILTTASDALDLG